MLSRMDTDETPGPAEAPLRPLDVDLVRELWSKTYNTQGKPDWSHIYPYYHDDVVFRDSIQTVEGLANFKALCGRLASRCKELRMDIHALAREGNVILMNWTMTMMFDKYPSTELHGATALTVHADGRIAAQRDYYDLWGDIFDNIPWFRKPYRNFMRKRFG